MKKFSAKDITYLAVILILGSILVYPKIKNIPINQDVVKIITTNTPTWSLFVASISLIVASVTTWMGWRRRKRLDTLEAWSKWSDATLETRSIITHNLGLSEITTEQAVALTTLNAAVPGREPGSKLTAQQKNETLKAIAVTLNGLERLALGHQCGIYSLEIFRVIGGTIIVRQFERLEPYIKAKREMANKDLRQATAYTSLESFKDSVRSRNASLDAARLKQLKRPTSG